MRTFIEKLLLFENVSRNGNIPFYTIKSVRPYLTIREVLGVVIYYLPN